MGRFLSSIKLLGFIFLMFCFSTPALAGQSFFSKYFEKAKAYLSSQPVNQIMGDKMYAATTSSNDGKISVSFALNCSSSGEFKLVGMGKKVKLMSGLCNSDGVQKIQFKINKINKHDLKIAINGVAALKVQDGKEYLNVKVGDKEVIFGKAVTDLNIKKMKAISLVSNSTSMKDRKSLRLNTFDPLFLISAKEMSASKKQQIKHELNNKNKPKTVYFDSKTKVASIYLNDELLQFREDLILDFGKYGFEYGFGDISDFGRNAGNGFGIDDFFSWRDGQGGFGGPGNHDSGRFGGNGGIEDGRFGGLGGIGNGGFGGPNGPGGFGGPGGIGGEVGTIFSDENGNTRFVGPNGSRGDSQNLPGNVEDFLTDFFNDYGPGFGGIVNQNEDGSGSAMGPDGTEVNWDADGNITVTEPSEEGDGEGEEEEGEGSENNSDDSTGNDDDSGSNDDSTTDTNNGSSDDSDDSDDDGDDDDDDDGDGGGSSERSADQDSGGDPFDPRNWVMFGFDELRNEMFGQEFRDQFLREGYINNVVRESLLRDSLRGGEVGRYTDDGGGSTGGGLDPTGNVARGLNSGEVGRYTEDGGSSGSTGGGTVNPTDPVAHQVQMGGEVGRYAEDDGSGGGSTGGGVNPTDPVARDVKGKTLNLNQQNMQQR